MRAPSHLYCCTPAAVGEVSPGQMSSSVIEWQRLASFGKAKSAEKHPRPLGVWLWGPTRSNLVGFGGRSRKGRMRHPRPARAPGWAGAAPPEVLGDRRAERAWVRPMQRDLTKTADRADIP